MHINRLTPKAFPPDFFARDTLTVARELLGHTLVKNTPEGGKPLIFRIVETEAYTGNDPACHAFGRTTGRAATLYKSPGLAYVYLIYGMYHCLNVVTEPAGIAGAVLFRALEPLSENPKHFRTNGPGRLTRALNITKAQFNETDLTSAESELFLAEGEPVDPKYIVTTGRIGIREACDYPWRFYIQGNSWVSVVEKKRSPKG
jgi:DNA-3-methyladenine glycosylase